MTDLAFVENYKRIRNKFNAQPKKVVPLKTAEEAVPVSTPRAYTPPEHITTLKVMQDSELRGYLRKVAVLENNISYRQALLKGSDGVPKRMKLAILPILEETNFSWEELFGKNEQTNRNSRTKDAVKTKWAIFREFHFNYGVTAHQIAYWCKMDHSSVLYGLGKLKKRSKGK